MTVSKTTTQEKARQLFSVATQGEGSFVVTFKGEFYDEFPEKDGAHAWVEDMSAKFAAFADSLTAELQKENARLREALEGLAPHCRDINATGETAFERAWMKAEEALSPPKGGAVQEGLSKEDSRG